MDTLQVSLIERMLIPEVMDMVADALDTPTLHAFRLASRWAEHSTRLGFDRRRYANLEIGTTWLEDEDGVGVNTVLQIIANRRRALLLRTLYVGFYCPEITVQPLRDMAQPAQEAISNGEVGQMIAMLSNLQELELGSLGSTVLRQQFDLSTIGYIHSARPAKPLLITKLSISNSRLTTGELIALLRVFSQSVKRLELVSARSTDRNWPAVFQQMASMDLEYCHWQELRYKRTAPLTGWPAVTVLRKGETFDKTFNGEKESLSAKRDCMTTDCMTMDGREAVTFGMAWAMQRLRC